MTFSTGFSHFKNFNAYWKLKQFLIWCNVNLYEKTIYRPSNNYLSSTTPTIRNIKKVPPLYAGNLWLQMILHAHELENHHPQHHYNRSLHARRTLHFCSIKENRNMLNLFSIFYWFFINIYSAFQNTLKICIA